MATPEIDNIIKLLHTPEVAYFLQTTEPRDAVVEQFVEALRALMFRSMDVVPADVQHYVADLLDPPPRPAGRPKVSLNDMQRLQRELRQRERDREDIAQVEALMTPGGSKVDAIRNFAKAKRKRSMTLDAAKRRYYEAKQRLDLYDAEMQAAMAKAESLLSPLQKNT